MRIIPFISIIAAMPSFFMMVHGKLYGTQSGEDPKKCKDESLLSHLARAEASFDNLIKNLSLLLGTSVLGMIADPPDAEEKAERVFNEFKESYNLFVSDFRALLNYTCSQKESLQAFFGSDWIKFETLRSAFEKPEVDWDYICEKKTLICDNSILKNERKYNSCLFEKLRLLISAETADMSVIPHDILPPEFASSLFENAQALNPAVDYFVNLISCIHREGKDE
ncbi:MAG: hypothetical protein PHV39_10545 [Methanomicrobium sp.]|nr:hypothetical protein [Methanomicrobium sp.]